MFPANVYVIRLAGDGDAADLRRIADLDSAAPLEHPILIGEIDGSAAAALSLAEQRAIADPFRRTAALLVHLRLRAAGLEAHARMPSVADRIRAALVPRRRAAA